MVVAGKDCRKNSRSLKAEEANGGNPMSDSTDSSNGHATVDRQEGGGKWVASKCLFLDGRGSNKVGRCSGTCCSRGKSSDGGEEVFQKKRRAAQQTTAMLA